MESASRSRWLALAGVCLGVFMFTLDSSIVNIAVPTLVRELNASVAAIQWVIQAYLSVVVVLILPLAHFSSRIGRTPVFLTGLVFMTAGMLVMHTFSDSMGEAGFLLRVTLFGVGMGLFNAPNAAVVMATAPRHLSEGASALLSLAIMVGQLLGVAVGGGLFHFLLFGRNGSEALKTFPPEVLAGAVADVLPLFALPLFAVLVSNLLRARRHDPVQNGLT